MYDANSSILDFYPVEFEQDLNGKKQDWEAIVKIPFIDEKRLLKAMGCECLFDILSDCCSSRDPPSGGSQKYVRKVVPLLRSCILPEGLVICSGWEEVSQVTLCR